METKTKLQITGGVCVLLLAGSIALNVRQKRRDRDSALFFSELERNISPGTVGLIESKAFDMYYWQNLGKTLKKSYFLLKAKDAQDAAKTIDSAWGYVDDDEDKIYGVFRALKDHVAVSQVSYQYYQKKKINLIDDLRARLSKDEVGEVLKIVNRMPPYRTA